jgi:glycine betaine/proline transport system substrate-binding protein
MACAGAVDKHVVPVSPLYDGARFFWAVPDYVWADQVAALPDLLRPEVTQRMATLVVQGTTPGAG